MEEALHLIPIRQDVYTLIFWSASWLSFFLSAVILFKSKLKSQIFILLAFVQFIMGALVYDLYLARSGHMKNALWYNDITEWMVLCIGPGLFLLSKILLSKKSVRPNEIFGNFAAPLLYLTYQLFYIVQPIEAKYNAYVDSFHKGIPLLKCASDIPSDPLYLKSEFEKLILLSVVGYAIAAARMVFKNPSFPKGRELFREFSRFSFIVWSLGSLFFNGILLFLLFVFMEEDQSHIYIGLVVSIEIIALTGFFILSSKAFTTTWVTDKYDTSSLSKKKVASIIDMVEKAILNESMFLKPGLSLKDLSESLNVPSNHISQAINVDRNQNFNDYVNSFRINAAIQLIQSEVSNQLTMEGIGKQVGFSSKSAFYGAFKKATGKTPTQFKSEER